ncbi:MAG: hypothetical protein GX565_09050 [Lentisphaerae bacterium]|jgi:hypothetical protein|nr:hypothetical protein [Lentisphaerota bacterium]
MNRAKRLIVCSVALACAAWVAEASPAMAPAAEASAAESAALDLTTITEGATPLSSELDLIGMLVAWSAAIPFDTRPFVGLMISIF